MVHTDFHLLYIEQIGKNQNSNISMANAGFDHPCELVVRDGVGMIHMRARTMSANSRKSGMLMQGKVQTVKYNYNNSFIDAEKNGDEMFSWNHSHAGISSNIHDTDIDEYRLYMPKRRSNL